MIELSEGGEWIRIGGFLAKRALVTHVWMQHVTSQHRYVSKIMGKAEYEAVPCDLWSVSAAVKNSGSHHWCATFDTRSEAEEFIIKASRMLALAPSRLAGRSSSEE